jgi:hypothetical protein
VGGRIADWGPLGDVDDVVARTAQALRSGDGTGPTATLRPAEVDEARIVATWLDGHAAPSLDLGRPPDRAALERFLTGAGAGGGVGAERPGGAPAASRLTGAAQRAARPGPLSTVLAADPVSARPSPRRARPQRARQLTLPESSVAPDAVMNA